MGACLEPTPDMGPYRVEIRGESYYLTRVDAPASMVTDRCEVEVPAADLPALLAALRQVMTHPQWERWLDRGQPGDADTVWTLPEDGDGPAADPQWSVTLSGDVLRLRGPWVVLAEPGRDLISGEIQYRSTAELRAELTEHTA